MKKWMIKRATKKYIKDQLGRAGCSSRLIRTFTDIVMGQYESGINNVEGFTKLVNRGYRSSSSYYPNNAETAIKISYIFEYQDVFYTILHYRRALSDLI